MVEEYLNFSSNKGISRPVPYSFVTNKYDVAPDSGYINTVEPNISADDAMLSAISTLQLQLTAEISILNCCSGFHRLISAFLWEGTGSANQSTIHCLQEEEDPTLRICCGRLSKQDPCWANKSLELNISL